MELDLAAAARCLHEFQAETLAGDRIALSLYRGQVVLVVNTASGCAFTPQFQGLQTLFDRYSSQGFVILGFPCNQFGEQEPGGPKEISDFCMDHFSVMFPMMAKVKVKGQDAHPLFQWLSRTAPGVLGTTAIKWNFTKFLVGRDGRVRRRFAPLTSPARLAEAIEDALAAP